MIIRQIFFPLSSLCIRFLRLRLAVYLVLCPVLLGLTSLSWGQENPVVPQSRQQITLTFAPLVKQTAPAVVNIYTQKVTRRQLSPLFDDPFFKEFFGRQLGLDVPRVQNALGSGVIVRESGLIVTNYHVIEGADEITVVLDDGREHGAEVVGYDERYDLALLKIDTGGRKLPFLAVRNSDELEVGDLVLAIGNPFGVGQTVTSGIVSALARPARGINDYSFFIQTDAAINPGNSGGALISTDGRLIGINTAIYSRSGGSIGIGFATPSNIVAAFLNQVERSPASGGRITASWIGVSGQDLSSELADGLGLPLAKGVLVVTLYPGSPAEVAGLKKGDVILSLNDQPIADRNALSYRLATIPIGKPVTIRYVRDGREANTSLAPIQAPETPHRDETEISGRNPLQGVVIANLSPALSEELGLRDQWEGVVITDIQGRNRTGLRPGDRILTLNNRKIRDVQGVLRAVGQDRSLNRWRVEVQRGERLLRLDIRV